MDNAYPNFTRTVNDNAHIITFNRNLKSGKMCPLKKDRLVSVRSKIFFGRDKLTSILFFQRAER